MDVEFWLNGTAVRAERVAPTETLLDWLRARGLTGTKEGCNEGDCGACTVMVTRPGASGAVQPAALNACILFLPQLHGAAVRTVEGIAGPDGTLHPVQAALIDRHGSQCGFCTPGFVVAMATAHANGDRDHETALAGNLCRCTGYAPILRAAEDAAAQPVPDWIAADRDRAQAGAAATTAGAPAAGPDGDAAPLPAAAAPGPVAVRPTSVDDLADWYAAHPDATLVAGATDVGLWVTKQHRDLGNVAFLNAIPELAGITVTDTEIRIGATATLADLEPVMATHHPAFAGLIRRYGSAQVRAAATVGGNIANGSPIGDSPPPLIALGATLQLRHGSARRTIPLEDFFLGYGRQERHPGEFVEAVSIPRQPDRLHVHKISKRWDQDISALCGAFNLTVEDRVVTDARIAFGGMAGTPQRARVTEGALLGQPLTPDSLAAAQTALAEDFAPISDMRASAAYRLDTAKHLLTRVFHDLGAGGVATDIYAVRA